MIKTYFGSKIAARFLPGLSSIFIIAIVALIIVLAGSQTGRILSLFGWESKNDLRGQVTELSSQVSTLQSNINERSLAMERIKERHREELLAIGRANERISQINTSLEISRQNLQDINRELRDKVQAVEVSLQESGEFDMEFYIVLPRSEVNQLSFNNYTSLLEHAGQVISPPSEPKPDTSRDRSPRGGMVVQVSSAMASVDTEEDYETYKSNDTTNIDLIDSLFALV